MTFEQVAEVYTYDTFVQFVPEFLKSHFCKNEWDTAYSPFQYNLVDDNLDFLLHELKKEMKFIYASKSKQIFDPDVAHWL